MQGNYTQLRAKTKKGLVFGTKDSLKDKADFK